MLMPIIAAVGSFVVSERILKPKATALVVLACLAVYDIFISPPDPKEHDNSNNSAAAIAINSTRSTNRNNGGHHDHDISELDEFWQYDADDIIEGDDLSTSLRCYRGPALLAFSLFCASYSLRMWRRNGVAVDELIFLPGTPHEFRLAGGSDHPNQNKSSHRSDTDTATVVEEGEAGDSTTTTTTTTNIGSGGEIGEIISPIKSCLSEGDAAAGAAKTTVQPIRRSQSHEYTAFEQPEAPNNANVEMMPLMLESSRSSPNFDSAPDSPITFIKNQTMKGIDMLVIRSPMRPTPIEHARDASTGESSSSSSAAPTTSTSNNEVYDADYAPSAPSVLGAALDLSLPVLFNFHMFVVLMKNHYKKDAERGEEDDGGGGSSSDHNVGNDNGILSKVAVNDYSWMKPPDVPPKVLPLFFITPLLIRSLVPPRQRRRFYKTVLQGTIFSPFKPVRFRDAFLADCVTSMIRVIKDLVLTLSYYWTVIFGLISGRYDLDRAGRIISHSMLMHGLVLPLLSILPLFIKFLQTLRQAYDTGKRWPYLGNAFKYFTAGLVVLYGMTHAAGERNVWWIWSFVLSCIYQIIWDSCIDWELLVFVPCEHRRPMGCTGSRFAILCRSVRDICNQVRLRPKRLFDDDSFYWKALFLNATLRFCWMAGFIPAYRVSILDGSTQVTFVDKAHGWSFVFLGVLEIFRRTIWGIIKVELETIKLTSGEENHDLAMASTADEYLREGKWVVPRDALTPKRLSPCQKVLSRCRSIKKYGRTNSLVAGAPNQYSKVEHTEQAEPDFSSEGSNTPSVKQKHRWLCFSFSGRFIRWLFILELLAWPCIFLVLSYYIIMAE